MTDANGHYSKTVTASALGTITATTLIGKTPVVASAKLAVDAPAFDLAGDGVFSWDENGGTYDFHGHINTPNVGELTLVLNNGGRFIDVAVTVNSSGNFDYSVALNMPTDGGVWMASATDVWGQSCLANTLVA
jgi:hypothetical protein